MHKNQKFLSIMDECIIFRLTARITKLLYKSSINISLMTIDAKKKLLNAVEMNIFRICNITFLNGELMNLN